jgi:hypothetical protein
VNRQIKLITLPIEVMILILLPFFVAVIATIIYTDKVIKSRKSADPDVDTENNIIDLIDNSSNNTLKKY